MDVDDTNPQRFELAQLKAKIAEALGPLLLDAQSTALIDFPDHDNVGDSAIWLGETAFLRQVTGRDPDYVSSATTYNAEDLRRVAPAGPILLSGGGNFGDLYLLHQNLREQVCLDFPDRPIIQLPQSIHFESSERFDRARHILGAHENFTLVVRDETSLATAQNIDCRVFLAPDMALCLGPLFTATQPKHELVALLRRDREAAGHQFNSIETLPSCRIGDWFVDHRPVMHSLEEYVRQRHGPVEAYERVAQFRLARGIEILASGERVITDRLHGHIISALLGKESFLLDNTYGKNSSFFRTWWRQLSAHGHCGNVEDLQAWLDQTLAPAAGYNS
jgi:pyruvyl transferase EpsO